jgi:hypothetical protein
MAVFNPAAITYFGKPGMRIARVMNDNGGRYRALAFK